MFSDVFVIMSMGRPLPAPPPVQGFTSPPHVQTFTSLYSLPPTTDMFEFVHYEAWTIGHKAVGIRLKYIRVFD